MALVQTASNKGLTNSLAITWGSNTTSKNLIVVGLSLITSSQSVSSISDSQGNTYTLVDVGDTGGGARAELWYAKNITGGTTPTITATISGSVNVAAFAREYSGIDSTSPLDQHAAASNISTSISAGPITTTYGGETLVAVTSVFSSIPTVSAGPGYGNLATLTQSGQVGIEDGSASSPGSYSGTFSLDISNTWSAVVASFVPTTLNVSDTITTSDTLPSYYTDQIDSMESRKLMVESYVNKSDTITTTENVATNPVSFISVSDNITTSEFPSIAGLINFSVNTSDTIGDAESVGAFTQLGDIVKSDTITTSENLKLLDELRVSVSDNTTISESLFELDTELEPISDTVTTSENVNLIISPFVQDAGQNSGSSSATATFAATPTQNNLLVAFARANVASASIAMTSSGWTLANSKDFSTTNGAVVFYKKAGSSESTSVQVTATGATSTQVEAVEFAFTGTTLENQASAGDTGVNVTARSSGTSGPTGYSGDLSVAAVLTVGSFGAQNALGWTNGYTAGKDIVLGVMYSYQPQSATSSGLETTGSWPIGVHAVGFLLNFFTGLNATTSDTATTSESLKLLSELNISTSDNLTTSESVGVLAVGANLLANVNDSTTTSESVLVGTDKKIPVSDSSSVTDSVSSYSDQVDVNENVAVLLVAGDLNVGTSDQVNTSESLSELDQDTESQSSDTTTTSEFVDVLHNGTRDISLVDNRILDESGSPVLDENGNFITDETPGGEIVLSSENVLVNVAIDFFISVSDTISSAEVVAVFLPIVRAISVFDATGITTEFIALAFNPELVKVADTVTTTESVANTGQSILSVSDTITTTEATTLAQTPLFINVSDMATTSENVQAQIPATVVIVKGLPIIVLDNGHLAIRLGGSFYQVL
jgi:hypothetical protein